VNSMIFMRRTSDDYNRWGALGGGSDWDWAGTLPYFRMSADFTSPNPRLVQDFGIEYDESAAWVSKGQYKLASQAFCIRD